MIQLINEMYEILNSMKNFTASYSTANANDGYMMIEYKGKRYAVKMREIKNPDENACRDIDNLPYLV